MEDAVRRSLVTGYWAARNSVSTLCFVMLLIVVATLSAYVWYTPALDYCTTASSDDPCYCPFPIWKRLAVGIVLAVEAATALFVVWVANEASGNVFRLNLYRVIFRIPLIVLYVVVAVAALAAFLYCNGPWTPFNPCNSRDWARAQDNYTASPCEQARGLGPLSKSDLTLNAAFVVVVINILVVVVLYAFITYAVDQYKDRKLELMGHGLAEATAFGERELEKFAIVTAVATTLYAATIVVADTILLVKGALPTQAFDLFTIWYMIWVVLQFALPLVVALCMWPLADATSKAIANVVVAIWVIKDILLLLAALAWYLLCMLPAFTGLSFFVIIPAASCQGVSTAPTVLFDTINVTTCVQLVLEVVLAFTLSATYRRLSSIKGNL